MSRFIGGGGIPADTNPPQPDNGKQWVDTSQSPPEVKIYDGATQAWLPADTQTTVVSQTEPTPERGKIWFEPAQDGTNMYAASSNKWEFLKFLPAIPDSVVTRPADSSTSGESNSRGLAISPASDFGAIGARISDNTTGVTRARVYDYSQSAYVKSVDISALSPGDAFTIDYGFDSGQDYGIELDANGSSYTVGFAGGAQDYPYTSTDVDIIAASIDGSQSTGDSAQGVNDIGNTGF